MHTYMLLLINIYNQKKYVMKLIITYLKERKLIMNHEINKEYSDCRRFDKPADIFFLPRTVILFHFKISLEAFS